MATSQGVYTGNLESGISQKSMILQDYVYKSGIHDREHSKLLSYKFPQFYVTALLDRLGASEGIARDVWSWPIMDRTRQALAVSGLPTGTARLGTETSLVATTDKADTAGYAIVGDIFRSESGALLRVTAVGASGGFQTITVSKNDGTAITIANLDNGQKIGHAFNSFGEASSAPEGRLYLPTEEYNYLGIIRRSLKISGSELTNRTILGDGKSWYFTVEDIEMKEFARDREILTMFGERVAVGNRKTSRGVLDYVLAEGVITNFTTEPTEDNLQAHILQLMKQNGSNEYTVLCGAKYMAGVQKALKPYVLNGGVSYGSFGSNTVGLDVQTYKFMGKTIHFTYYELFEDQAILPFVGTASATKINFSNFSLWLDLGKDDTGKKLISLKHKEHNGINRKFVHGHEVGMVNAYGKQGGQVNNGVDAFTVHFLSEIGTEVRMPNRFGIMKANA